MIYFQQPKTTGTWCEYDSVLWRKNMASPDGPATHYPHGIAAINYSMSTYFRGWDGSIFYGSIGGRWPSLPEFLRVWQSWTPFLFSNQFHSDVLETQHTVWIFTKLTSRTFHNAPIASLKVISGIFDSSNHIQEQTDLESSGIWLVVLTLFSTPVFGVMIAIIGCSCLAPQMCPIFSDPVLLRSFWTSPEIPVF